MPTIRPEDFTAPEPGVWRFDPMHFPHPMSRLAEEIVNPSVAAGAAAGNARYSSFAGPFQLGLVLRFGYTQLQPLD